MSLLTDIIFTKALRSNTTLMASLPAGDVYNTAIPLPDPEADNADTPYIIVAFNGLNNGEQTKDDRFEGSEDTVSIGITVAADTRESLGNIVQTIRTTVREFFTDIEDDDEDIDLVPEDYNFSAGRVEYDPLKPCFVQVLNYQCTTQP